MTKAQGIIEKIDGSEHDIIGYTMYGIYEASLKKIERSFP